MPQEGQPEHTFHVYDESGNFIESLATQSAASDQASSIGGVVVQGGDHEGKDGTKVLDFSEKPPPIPEGVDADLLKQLMEGQKDSVRASAVQIAAGICSNPTWVATDSKIENAVLASIEIATKIHGVIDGRLKLTSTPTQHRGSSESGKHADYRKAQPGKGPPVSVVLPRTN